MFLKSAVTPCQVSTACQHKESLLSKGNLFFDVNVSDKSKITVTLVLGEVAR